MLRALWLSRSVRAQLLLVFVAVGAVAALVAGAVTILKARAATRVEIAASMQLAELMVKEAVQLTRQGVSQAELLLSLPSQLRLVRHVRVDVRDEAGKLVTSASDGASALTNASRATPPTWFAALISPPIEQREVPVIADGRPFGSVQIVSQPADEIAEVWENTVALGIVAFAMGAALVAVLYGALGRVLAPLAGLSSGLADLEHRNYQVRLPRPKMREFAAITDRFNALAETLGATRAENLDLGRRLVSAQDDERRRTALDLHDEVGPSLFGLRANAASLAKAANALPEPMARAIAERVRQILDIVEHLQSTNRRILKRLRPMALGHVPLADLLSDMIRDRAEQHPDIAFMFSPGLLAHGYGDSVDLTVYRCVQEGLTNAIRHANPKRIEVEVVDMSTCDTSSTPRLQLAIRDDGEGIRASGIGEGFGLQGMRERLQALGGELSIDSASGCGTRLRIQIPIAAGQAADRLQVAAGAS